MIEVKRRNPNNIFVDTNVLIGAFANNTVDKHCLQYLYSLHGKQLFTSALSVAQLVSVFQKKKQNHEIKTIVRSLLSKFTIIGFSSKDIEASLSIDFSDMEDNIQYVISSKFDCFHFVTNNKRDYNRFLNIKALLPKEVRVIEQ
ncbi:MAG: hypothetical protein LBM68_03830 [Bacteroidales bacterium]|jgi:predicted nucleic acid-binding protein|nr:hypothetical protein [Bacteroidales bacterium]